MNTQALGPVFDVVIMGGGFAGQVQARHLLLNVPDIRIAIIDPRSDEEILTRCKVGESMIEIASTFLQKDLGLHEYLIENQVPKHGLNFHWPRAQASASMDDYYSLWMTALPPLPSFQLHRGRFELDLQRMNVEAGATLIRGRVARFELTEGDDLSPVTVDRGSDLVTVYAKHLIDAGGRAMLIGRQTNNIRRDDEATWGIDNGSAWVRVRNIDRTIFDSGYHPNRTAASNYYATNQFFGHGHWVWMIPIDTEDQSVSIGVVFHNSEVDAREVNTEERFLDFLARHHEVLHRLVESGAVIDFHFRNHLSYASKTMFSEDNWYVLGDSAAFGDPFYSMGTSCIAIAAESITEIIRAKLAGEEDADEKRDAFNRYNLEFNRHILSIYREHARTLGNASVMSWRIFAEYIWYFGALVPIFLGKWHLEPRMAKLITRFEHSRHVFNDIYDLLRPLAERGANIGIMDFLRANQLFGNYHTFRQPELATTNAMYEPRRLNLFRWFANAYLFTFLFCFKLVWRGYGVRGFLHPKRWWLFARTLGEYAASRTLSVWYRWKIRGRAPNSEAAARSEEFAQNYRPPRELAPAANSVEVPGDNNVDVEPATAPRTEKVPVHRDRAVAHSASSHA